MHKIQANYKQRNIVIAIVNGNNATCKRLTKYTSGIALISYNPIIFTNEEIIEKPVKIIGKVVELIGKL